MLDKTNSSLQSIFERTQISEIKIFQTTRLLKLYEMKLLCACSMKDRKKFDKMLKTGIENDFLRKTSTTHVKNYFTLQVQIIQKKRQIILSTSS